MNKSSFTIKKLLTLFVLISFTFSNISNSYSMPIDKVGGPSKVFDFDFEAFFENYSQNQNLPESEQQKIQELLKQPTSVLVEIMYLWTGLEKKIQAELKNTSVEKLHKIVTQRKDSTSIAFEVEGVGKAELTTLGTDSESPFLYKIRHNGIRKPIVIASSKYIQLHQMEQQPSAALSLNEQKEQLEIKKALSKEWRKLIANLMNAEWNEQNKYTPLPEVLEEESRRKNMTDAQLKSHLDDLALKSATDLEQMSWYNRQTAKLKNWYHLAISEVQFDKPQQASNEEVIVIFINPESQKVDRTEFHIKPSTGSLEHLRMLFDYYFEPPSYRKDLWKSGAGGKLMTVLFTGDYGLGLSMGLVLGGLSYTTGQFAAAHNQMLPGLTPIDLALITFIWSYGMAIANKPFFQKWFLKGSELSRFYKNQIVGFMNSLNILALSDVQLIPFNKDLSVNPQSAKALTDVTVNQIIKNYTKSHMYEIPKYRDKTGASSGTIKIPYYVPQFMHRDVTGKTSFFMLQRKIFDTAIKKSTFEMQSIQFITTPISLLSRLGIMIPLMNTEQIQKLAAHLGTSEFTLAFLASIPIGHLAYVALGPLAQKFNIIYRKYHMRAHILERRLEAQSKGGIYNPLRDAQVTIMKRDIIALETNWEKLKLGTSNRGVLYSLALSQWVYANLYKIILAPSLSAFKFFRVYNMTEFDPDKTAHDTAIQKRFDEAKEAFEKAKNGVNTKIPFSAIFRFYKKATGDLLMTLPKFLATIAVQTEYRFRYMLQEDLKAQDLMQERIFENQKNPTKSDLKFSCANLFSR